MHFRYRQAGFPILFLLFCTFFLGSAPLYAQKRTSSADSAAAARRQLLEASRAAQKSEMEVVRAARQKSIDSLKAIRQHTTDSLTAIRNYRNSKRYKDSVTRSRESRMTAVRNASKSRTDSMKAARQHITDSLVASRKSVTDALKSKQKHRTDSLAAIRKYKESKRYTDSVTVVRRVRLDSVRAERKRITDGLATNRKHTLDSTKAIRKVYTDSLTAARKHFSDSLKSVRKVKSDALAKAKADKAKADKGKQKKMELDLSLKIDMKRKKAQEAWDNSKMLKKKWSVPRKLVQNTFTRYNYYFNANRKMEEAHQNMQRLGRDDFDKPIALFSFNPAKDSARFAADMDSVIQKASLGIQIHDPRAKWQDDLYLLLGEAYYNKGNFEQASNSFRYIIAESERRKVEDAKKHAYSNSSVKGTRREEPSVVTPEKKGITAMLAHVSANNDALLWLVRTYVQDGKYDAAESVLDLLSADSKFPDNLRGRLALEKANYDLAVQNYKDASVQLAVVSADKSQDWYIRRRSAFLAGQLMENAGRYNEAAAQFSIVTDLNPKIDMDFYARKARAYSLMRAGVDQNEAIASLRSMLNDNKYLPYHEQVYYILGQLSANTGNSTDAEKYLRQSLATSRTTKKQRALTFATLGNVYYSAANYAAAKRAYDSAAILGGSAAGDTAIMIAAKRARVLDKVTYPARTIQAQDSLRDLASMSEKEQRAVVRRYLRNLERQKNDTTAGTDNGPLTAFAQNDNVGPGNEATSWYFSNPQLVQQGYTEFKRKWGNRPLADNWRRSAAISMGSNPVAEGIANGGDVSDVNYGAGDANDGLPTGAPTEGSLMAAIPTSQAQKDIAARATVRAYLDLATAYVSQLEDYPRATHTLDTLAIRYPTHSEKAEELYIRYLIALRQNNLSQAQQLSGRLQQEYNTTKWASLVRPATEDGTTAVQENNTASVSEYYNTTYDMMMTRQWPEVINRSRNARQRYNDENYTSRFRIMEAIALAGQEHYNDADTIVSEYLRNNPTGPLHSWAEGVQAYIQHNRKIDTPKSTPLPLPDAKVAALPTGPVVDSLAAAIPPAYVYNASEPHYFIFLFKKFDSKAMGVKAAMGDFNTLKFGALGLGTTLEQLSGGEGLVVTRGFKTAAQAKVYMQRWKTEPSITREYKADEYRVMIISAANYLRLMAVKNTAAYISFYQAHY